MSELCKTCKLYWLGGQKCLLNDISIQAKDEACECKRHEKSGFFTNTNYEKDPEVTACRELFDEQMQVRG